MPTESYAPGGWSAVVAPGAWLLVDELPSAMSVQAMARRMTSGLGDVLDALARTGLLRARSFALVVAGEPGLVLVRGEVTVEVTDATGARSAISGAHTVTWLEAALPSDVAALTLSGQPAVGAAEHPAPAGVVGAASLRLDWTGADEAGADGAGVQEAGVQEAGEDEAGTDEVVLPPPPTVATPFTGELEAPAPPLVSSVLCPRGHPNPPGTASCRACGDTVEDQPASPRPRPRLGRSAATTERRSRSTAGCWRAGTRPGAATRRRPRTC